MEAAGSRPPQDGTGAEACCSTRITTEHVCSAPCGRNTAEPVCGAVMCSRHGHLALPAGLHLGPRHVGPSMLCPPRPTQCPLISEWLCVCMQDGCLLGQPWYAGSCDRQAVERALLCFQKVGSCRPQAFSRIPSAHRLGWLSRQEQETREGVDILSQGWGGQLKTRPIAEVSPTGRGLHSAPQLGPSPLSALHAGSAPPRPGIQHSHPAAGGRGPLCPGPGGQEPRGGECWRRQGPLGREDTEHSAEAQLRASAWENPQFTFFWGGQK